jgi:hypothetical protein
MRSSQPPRLLVLLALSALCTWAGACADPARMDTPDASFGAHPSHTHDDSTEGDAAHTHDASDESDPFHSHDASYDADAADVPGSTEADASGLVEVQLTDNESWQGYPASLDPLSDHQPAMINCPDVAWFPEGNVLDIETSFCNYLLVQQPSKAAVPAGSELELELRYFDLRAAEAATAHLAFLFDRDVQWELSIPIPSDGAENRWRFRATRGLAAGEPIRLHLHNHGTNSWLIGKVLAWVP